MEEWESFWTSRGLYVHEGSSNASSSSRWSQLKAMLHIGWTNEANVILLNVCYCFCTQRCCCFGCFFQLYAAFSISLHRLPAPMPKPSALQVSLTPLQATVFFFLLSTSHRDLRVLTRLQSRLERWGGPDGSVFILFDSLHASMVFLVI